MMSDWPSSLQLIASRDLGGAERWYERFVHYSAADQAPLWLGVRRGSALSQIDFGTIPCYQLPFWTVWDGVSRRAVRRLVAQVQPDIVQTYLGRATRLTVTKQAIHVARLGGYYQLNPYRHADAWIGNTLGLCDWMVRQGLPVSRVHAIYNFIAEPTQIATIDELNALRNTLQIEPDAWVFVTLGRLIPVKGHADLLAALARVPKMLAGRPWCLVVVGDGPLRNQLDKQARRYAYYPDIRWVGWQLVPDRYLQLADIVIFPSWEQETFGNVILESWAWQRPLLVTRFRGACELVRHGEDAWTTPCNDAPALAQAVSTLMNDQSLRTELVANGLQRVRHEFSPPRIIAQYKTLYRHLTSHGSG
jgi:hypothetical protein